MKKQILGILTGVVLAAMLTACGGKDTSQTASGTTATAAVGNVTKAEWVGHLGESFGYSLDEETEQYFSDVDKSNEYYSEIEACYEWGVLEENGKFDPDAKITYEYAVKTAVRAIGLERINNSGKSVDENSLVNFFNSNIADLSSVKMEDAIPSDVASEVINLAMAYRSGIKEAPVFESTYADGVNEIAAADIEFKGDGKTATLKNGQSYSVGDIIYVLATDTTAAAPLKVTAVNGSDITFTYVDVTDVFSDVTVSGTYAGTIIGIQAANIDDTMVGYANGELPYALVNVVNPYQNYRAGGTVFEKNSNTLASNTGCSFTSNSAHFDTAVKGGGTFSVDITDIDVSPYYDIKWFEVKKAGVDVKFNDTIDLTFSNDDIFSKSIPLGSVDINVGTTGFMVRLSLTANIGVSGEVSVTYKSTVTAGVNYEKGKSVTKYFNNTTNSFDFHAEATITAEATAKADLRFGVSKLSASIANLKVTTGAVGVAKVDVDLMGNMPTCIDIFVYVPFRWAINGDSCVITDIIKSAKYEQTVWDSTNSPFTLNFHWEDGVLVDGCTRGQEEQVESDGTDEEGKPFDEYKYFDFEDLEFGFIDLGSPIIILNEGESATIDIVAVPDGYGIGDLTYSVENSSVATVSGGTVSAGSTGGTTNIKISTSDGKYSTMLTVTVNAGLNDTSGFQDL